MRLDRPVYYSAGEVHLVALPCDEYRMSYTLHYPKAGPICSQYCSIAIESDSFRTELAPCRTFALYEELSALMDAGLIKGGSLDSAVVIKGDEILTNGGLHFPNELARHKVLDLVGDLRLMGVDIQAHVLAVRSGHKTNVAFAETLLNHITAGDAA